MWHRRIPHHSVGESFHLGESEAEFKEQVREDVEGLFAIPVEELQDFFRRLDSFDAVFEHPRVQPVAAEATECDDMLAAIWNYTTREEFGGRRPIELYLREVVRAGDVDLDSDYGTKHVQCEHTGELLTHPDFFGPAFFAFVEGRDLHGLDMGARHTRFGRE